MLSCLKRGKALKLSDTVAEFWTKLKALTNE